MTELYKPNQVCLDTWSVPLVHLSRVLINGLLSVWKEVSSDKSCPLSRSAFVDALDQDIVHLSNSPAMHTQEEEGIHQITGRGSGIVSNWNGSPKRKCNRYKNIALYLGQKQLHKYAMLQLQAVQGRKMLEGFRHITLTVVNYNLSRGEQNRETIQDHFTWGTVKGTH